MRHTLLAASLLLPVALTIYTIKNNWAAADSSDSSAAFTETVVNASAQPETKSARLKHPPPPGLLFGPSTIENMTSET